MPPTNVVHLFGSWLNQGGSNLAELLLTGAAAFCWALWLTRNDLTFNKCHSKTLLQVLFRGTHWLRFWAQLQRTDDIKDNSADLSKPRVVCDGVVCFSWMAFYV